MPSQQQQQPFRCLELFIRNNIKRAKANVGMLTLLKVLLSVPLPTRFSQQTLQIEKAAQ